MASGRIKGITVEIGGDTTGLDKALSSVNKSITSTEKALKDVNKLLKLDPTNTELLAQKHKLLQNEITQTKDKLQTLKEADKDAKKQLQEGKLGQEAYDALQREIVETEEKLKQLEKTAGSASATLAKISQVTGELSDKAKAVADALMPLSAAATAVGVAGVKTAADFESASSQIAATMGTTTDQITDLLDKAKELGATTAFSATEAAQGLNILAMSGLNAEDQMAAIGDVLNLAAAGSLSLEQAASYTTGTIKGFGDSMDNASKYTDLIAKGATLANTNVSQLGEALSRSASTASSYSQTADGTTLSLLRLAEQNVVGSEASTMLNRAMADLFTPTEAAQKALDALGVSAYDSSGNARDFNEVVDELNGALAGMSEEERNAYKNTIFTTNGLNAFNKMTVSSTDKVAQFKDGLASASDGMGAAAQQSQTMMDNLNGQLTILKSAIEALLISVGETLMPIIKAAVSVIQMLVDKFNGLDQVTKTVIVAIGAIVAALGPAFLIGSKILAGISKITGEMSKLSVATKVGPIAVIALLVAAFMSLWTTSEDFRNSIIASVERVINAFNEFGSGVTEILSSVGINFESFSELLTGLWTAFTEILAPLFEGAFSLVADILETVLGVMQGLLEVFIGIFTGDWTKVWNGASTIFSSVWNGIKSVLTTVLNTLKGLINTFLGWMGTSWSSVWNSVKTTVTTIVNSVVSFAVSAFTSLRTGISNAISSIPTVFSNIFNQVKSYIMNLKSQAYTWGSDFINGLKNGIMSGVNRILDTVRNMASKVRSMLHFSRPDEGPLRDYETWMPDFMEGLAKGVTRNTYKVENAMQQLAEKMNLGSGNGMKLVAEGGIGGVNMDAPEVNVFIGNKQLKDYIVETSDKGIGSNQKAKDIAKGK